MGTVGSKHSNDDNKKHDKEATASEKMNTTQPVERKGMKKSNIPKF